MFINLVKINLIRLFKNRVTKYCAIGVFALIALDILMYQLVAGDYISNKLVSENIEIPVFWAFFMAFISIPFSIIANTIITLFTTTDYYKYRQMVNIEGAIRSRLKICLAEIVAMYLFSFVPALTTIVTLVYGSISDVDRLGIVTHYFDVLIVFYLFSQVAHFSFSLPVYAFSKIFQKKLGAILCSLILIPSLATVIFSANVVGVATVASMGNRDSVTATYYIVDLISDSSFATALAVLIGFVINSLFWIVVALIASVRKRNL